MTPELLAGTASILLSLLFSYVPGLNTWYAAQTSVAKSLIMLAALAVVAAGSLVMACAGVFTDILPVTCTQGGAEAMLKVFIAAAVANQATYKLSPQTNSVTAAKSNRPQEYQG